MQRNLLNVVCSLKNWAGISTQSGFLLLYLLFCIFICSPVCTVNKGLNISKKQVNFFSIYKRNIIC